MVGIFLADIFDAEVVRNEAERYWLIFLMPKDGHILEGLVFILGNVPGELVFVKDILIVAFHTYLGIIIP